MAGRMGAKGFTAATRPSDFLKNVLQNGVGRHVQQLQRITLRFCQKSPHSKQARDFIEESLPEFARKNPGVVCYVTPEPDVEPKICAEYLNGKSYVHSLKKLTQEEITNKCEELRNLSGREIVRIRKKFHTDFPSIQGEWTPFTNLKNYRITDPTPQCEVVPQDAWSPKENPWKGLYRRHELKKVDARPELTYEEREKRPLGKWGPILPPSY